MFFNSILETIGNTPVVALNRLAKGLPGDLIVTLVCDSGLKYLSTDLVE
jgi:cysteine synthase